MEHAAFVCHTCGGRHFDDRRILWARLIAEWQLAPEEVRYIDRQQGTSCRDCGANLRSIALAKAILAWAGDPGPLQAWLATQAVQGCRVLEVNEAGTLSPELRRLPHHVLASYPEVDVHALPYADASFDLVVHSDTLEHVSNPIRALAECKRVLRPRGGLCFTVPIVIGRLSRSRAGLPPSFHGSPETSLADWAVQTEFGADAWTSVIRAGFEDVMVLTVDYPSASAFMARKSPGRAQTGPGHPDTTSIGAERT
jgi:SAM-dependent methyltransferase